MIQIRNIQSASESSQVLNIKRVSGSTDWNWFLFVQMSCRNDFNVNCAAKTIAQAKGHEERVASVVPEYNDRLESKYVHLQVVVFVR